MKDYLVVWKDDCGVIQSKVSIMSNRDPRCLSNNEWVKLAAINEDYSESEIEDLLKWKYELYLVCDFPPNFYI